jgi:hypothetical protein
MQTSTRIERFLSLPRYVLLVIALVVVLIVGGSVFYLTRSNSGAQSTPSSLPHGVVCVPASVIKAPPPPPGTQASHTAQKAICPAGYVPQPVGHAAPKGMPKP